MKTQIVHVIAQKLFSTPHVKYSHHYSTTGPDFCKAKYFNILCNISLLMVNLKYYINCFTHNYVVFVKHL